MQETACNNNIQCNHCSERWAVLKPPFESYRISSHGRMMHRDEFKIVRNIKPSYINGSKVMKMHFRDESGKIRYTSRGIGIMVAENFLPNPNQSKRIIFKNGDKTDCRVENLEWLQKRQKS